MSHQHAQQQQQAHGASCLCKLCDCGKHRCGRPALPTVDTPLDAASEYATRFPSHPVTYAGQRKPPAHVARVDAPLSSVTESREQYAAKSIPPKFQLPKREYHPTDAALEAVTGYMSDFKPWFGARPRSSSKKPDVYKPSGPLEGTTTNKADFQTWTIPERYRHPRQQYNPNPAPLASNSSYTSDYPAHMVTRPSQRPPEKFVSTHEERDFATTMRANYVPLGAQGLAARAKPARPPAAPVANGSKLESSTTTHTDYAPPKVGDDGGKRASCKPPASVLQTGTFDGASEYCATFTPKAVPPPPKRRPAQVPGAGTGNHVGHEAGSKLEGVSTMKADYVGFYAPKRADFGPKLVYHKDTDDRAFVTETKAQHGVKDVPACNAVKVKVATHAELKRDKDGHIYLVPETKRAAAV